MVAIDRIRKSMMNNNVICGLIASAATMGTIYGCVHFLSGWPSVVYSTHLGEHLNHEHSPDSVFNCSLENSVFTSSSVDLCLLNIPLVL